jgi:hypothetical protein
MHGWSKQKRDKSESDFYKFLDRCFVNSKDAGRICLGKSLYDGQIKFITTVFDGLEQDIHKIYVLKSRQLGLSTISRALSIFYLGTHPGLKGALVFDTAPHKESARKELVTMVRNLPASLKFPKAKGTGEGNRDSFELVNDSGMVFMSAGVKKSKSSGTLGRSEGLTMAHLSELCSYDNDEGLKSFEQSLSEFHPDRLYIYESTARGFNQWNQMWKRAKADDRHCKCLFLGWWSKPSQRIDRDHPDFELYGLVPPSPEEADKIKQVKELYGVDITQEQLAWVRRKFDPNYGNEDATDEDSDTDDSIMLAEQAWTEEEAFQQSGAVFFGSKQLTDQTNNYVKHKAKTYMFLAGDNFVDMRVYPAQNMRSVELKVWEEPQNGAQYVMGVDPAFGENENNDRSSIFIGRCYADGIDQVAEYAWPLITTRQFAWVIASLLGWYGQTAEINYILEINGPGSAVFNELRSLKFQIENDRVARRDLDDRGLLSVFKNVKTYIYTRVDAMGAGSNYHWETNVKRKIMILERMRDFVSTGKLRIRSAALIEEMKTIAREGDSISAPQSMRDDRVISAALASYYWDTKIRNLMITSRRTREAEMAKQRASIVDQVALFNRNHLDMFFGQKKAVRAVQQRQVARNAWRYGR